MEAALLRCTSSLLSVILNACDWMSYIVFTNVIIIITLNPGSTIQNYSYGHIHRQVIVTASELAIRYCNFAKH